MDPTELKELPRSERVEKVFNFSPTSYQADLLDYHELLSEQTTSSTTRALTFSIQLPAKTRPMRCLTSSRMLSKTAHSR